MATTIRVQYNHRDSGWANAVSSWSMIAHGERTIRLRSDVGTERSFTSKNGVCIGAAQYRIHPDDLDAARALPVKPKRGKGKPPSLDTDPRAGVLREVVALVRRDENTDLSERDHFETIVEMAEDAACLGNPSPFRKFKNDGDRFLMIAAVAIAGKEAWDREHAGEEQKR